MPLPPDFEKRLWDAADQLWTNSTLKPHEYSMPVLALIFLRYVDQRFAQAEKELAGGRRRGKLGKEDYHGLGVLYVPPKARFSELLKLPEGADIGKALNDAMEAIEADNDEVKGVLPHTYGRFQAPMLKAMLKVFNTIPEDVEGDVFGRIYEYFLGNFAPRTLEKGGEFYTPYSVVRLIVEILEPYHGTIYDPACGSGGMFVQSANFIAEHQRAPADEISIYGIEKIAETYKLAKLNLAVHGLASDIKSELNSYYDDPHGSVGKFDFVMANPPFNQNAVDRERIKDDTRRYPFGMPASDNANYLWIQLFYSSLKKDKGRAGFVMANSAADARGSELEIRKKLLETGAVDVIVSLTSNLFYTVTLPVTLWFLDKGKGKTDRKDKVLFVDARHQFRQVDRAHREMTGEQVEFLANIVRLYRGEPPENRHGDGDALLQSFPEGKYEDLPWLCKVATLAEIAERGWSLNPAQYVGLSAKPMLEYLHLENVGPAGSLTLKLAPRLNLITGDNGLGKSFLLDVAWWALTKTWPAEVNSGISAGLKARPARSGPASIEFSFQSQTQRERYRSEFERREEIWKGRSGRPANPGLVLYAQVDGGFSVWDPARNYSKTTKKNSGKERQPAYVFSSREVWDGLKRGDTQLCNGLLADWALWQKEGGEPFRQLSEVLASLSPSPEERLAPGSLGKLSIDDARWIPTLKTPYGLEVPLLMASAAIKRVVSLAYLLVWSWQEHLRNAPLLDEAPTRQVTFLIDELECHLHPRWQRTIVRSLLEVMHGLAGSAAVQIVAATHSPLLLASVEPLFDEATDAWFDMDLVQKDGAAEVQLTRRPFIRRGDASSWLTSEAFDLGSGYSLEAEEAMTKARALLRLQDRAPQEAVDAVDEELRRVLGEIDPFWVRWSAYVERCREGR